MIVIPYEEKYLKEWDDFIENESENGTIFHMQKFLSYHPKDRFKDCSLLIKNNKNQIIAIFTSAIVDDSVISHPGSTYGGIILKKYLKLKDIELIVNSIFTYLKNNYPTYSLKIINSEDFFRSNDKIELFLLNKGMNLISKEISVVIDIEQYFTYKGIRKRTKEVIKSKRFIKEEVEFTIALTQEEKEEAYKLVYNNLKEKYNKTPTHTFEELLDIENKLNNSIFYFVIKKDMKIVATYICFKLSNDVMHTFYIAKSPKRGNYIDVGLIDFIVRYLKDNNYKYFNFGISSREKIIKYWLQDYKEQYSKLFLTRDIWYIEDISLLEDIDE